MNVKYLGTGSSEGVPSLFCNCANCLRARELRGKNLRSRCQVLVNKDLLIDFSPDTFSHVLDNKFDINLIENILISHSHTDHFYASDLILKMNGYSFNADKKINIYGSEDSKRVFDLAFEFEGRFDHDRITYHVLKPYETVKIGDYAITPILANHIEDEICFLYIIEDKFNKTMLYGHDTGIVPDKTYEYLSNMNIKFDLISIDGTFYKDKRINGFEVSSHLNVPEVLEFKNFLLEKQLIDVDTVFILSHISHHIPLTHSELEKELMKSNCLVAYDDLELTLGKEHTHERMV